MRVYIQLYPQLGGLGWLLVREFHTAHDARQERQRLIREGHDAHRVVVRS
jgi:hypothetical protein